MILRKAARNGWWKISPLHPFYLLEHTCVAQTRQCRHMGTGISLGKLPRNEQMILDFQYREMMARRSEKVKALLPEIWQDLGLSSFTDPKEVVMDDNNVYEVALKRAMKSTYVEPPEIELVRTETIKRFAPHRW